MKANCQLCRQNRMWKFLQLKNVGFCVGAECVLVTDRGVVDIMRVLIIRFKKAALHSDGKNGVGVEQLWGSVRVD